MRVGLLHPGQMGASVGAAAMAAGAEVLWASEGRSPATRERAESAGSVYRRLRGYKDRDSALPMAEILAALRQRPDGG